MTITTGTTSTQAGAATTTPAVSSNGDISSMFTTLLVAQIQNQDPLNPTDSSQYVTQLAQLSQVQSLTALTTQGTANQTLLQAMQAQSLGLQVGSQVTANTSQVVLGTQAVTGDFTLANSSTATTLLLKNAAGAQQTIALGSQAAGDVPFSINPTSLGLAAGSYSISISTSSGETPAIEVQGTLNSVKISPSGGVLLDIAGIGQVASTAVTGFNGYSTTATTP
jgi:flagellar basal-body rod modification protein FlgD